MNEHVHSVVLDLQLVFALDTAFTCPPTDVLKE